MSQLRFNAKPVVQAAADSAINVPYLDTVLYLMGISRAEVEYADAIAAAEADQVDDASVDAEPAPRTVPAPGRVSPGA